MVGNSEVTLSPLILHLQMLGSCQIIMLNIGKCKYMVISRKRFPIQPVSLLSASPGESVHF